MQTLLFGALLAFARGHQDDDPFFAWVAGRLGALLIFLRFDTFMALAGIGAALALRWIVQGRAAALGIHGAHRRWAPGSGSRTTRAR